MAVTSPESQWGPGRQVWSKAKDSGRQAALRLCPLGILEVLCPRLGRVLFGQLTLGDWDSISQELSGSGVNKNRPSL